MIEASIRSLAEVLSSIQSQPWSHAVYVDTQRPWRKETQCAVLDPNDIEDPDSDDDPEFAMKHGLKYALTVGTAQDIVDNTRQQKAQATLADLIKAFNYYYDHDAFIEW